MEQSRAQTRLAERQMQWVSMAGPRTDDPDDLIIKAAWYYYVEDMTQAEIGERLLLTRRRVNEMLAEARESGLVSINFNSGLKDCARIEAELVRRLGLDVANVVPTPENPDLIHKVLGRATAQFLDRLVQTRKPTSIGVGWGSTLRETILQFSRTSRVEGLKVYSIIGGLTYGTEINTFETVRGFAEVLGASSHYLVAPIYTESVAARDAMLSQKSFRQTFEALGKLDMALVSVGDVTSKSLLVKYGLPEGVGTAELKAAGAVGDLIGRYLDAEGQPVDHPINAQVMSPELDVFRGVPLRIAAGGGRHKHAIMKAIVRAGHVNAVVTDTDCAEAMLRAAGN